MEDATIPEFEIRVNFENENQIIKIKPEETSDGDMFYTCNLDGKMITQIRFEKREKWKQIWGNLEDSKVNVIGEAIDEKNKKDSL